MADEPVGHDRVLEHGRVADVWPLLCTADVVVGPCGGGLVADVAAAGTPFLALPQPRPFGEQVALGRLLRRAGVASVAAAWPSPAVLAAGAGRRWPRTRPRPPPAGASGSTGPARPGRRPSCGAAGRRPRPRRARAHAAGPARAGRVSVRAAVADPVRVPGDGVAPRAAGPAAAHGVARVVHVPADHDYVRHATTSPGAAAPAAVAERFSWADGAGWLGRHGDSVDVLHVHFGAEQVDEDGLASVLDAADRAGVAVVWTVHDLTNPHLVDQSVHEAQCALLARRSAGLVTLTAGAAEEVRRRWGRVPVVVPHPHLAPTDVLARPRPRPGRAARGRRPARPAPAGDRPRGRPGAARPRGPGGPPPADAEAGRAGRAGPTVRARCCASACARRCSAPASRGRTSPWSGRCARPPTTGWSTSWWGRAPTTRACGPSSAGLAALVLPYRWGTHSGWVEACHDVGTPVVAPALGRWGEQHAVHAFGAASPAAGPDPDPASLARALGAALAQGPRRTPVLDERLREREASVRTHARLHATAAAGGRW